MQVINFTIRSENKLSFVDCSAALKKGYYPVMAPPGKNNSITNEIQRWKER